MVRWQAVPGPLVLVLCVFSFMFGRFMQQGANLPEPTPIQLDAGGGVGAVRRLGAVGGSQQQLSLVADTSSSGDVAGPVQTAPVPLPKVSIDPLDPAQLETWTLETSGLMKLRPPMPPAESGDPNYHVIPFQILSWYPRLVVFPGFVDKARCDHIVAKAKALVYPSGLAYRPGEQVEGEQQTRTSTGTFLTSYGDPEGVLSWVEQRIAAATLIPAENGEAFNVLHYENMQHYDSHYDSFDPKDFGPQPSQRIATVLLYLTEVLEGGETVFKREGVSGADRVIQDWRNCDDGSYKYKPRMGDAVLFFSAFPSGTLDPHSLHGGCPIKQGEKWVATKWIRDKGMPGYN